jgi:hypothetical protein
MVSILKGPREIKQQYNVDIGVGVESKTVCSHLLIAVSSAIRGSFEYLCEINKKILLLSVTLESQFNLCLHSC